MANARKNQFSSVVRSPVMTSLWRHVSEPDWECLESVLLSRPCAIRRWRPSQHSAHRSGAIEPSTSEDMERNQGFVLSHRKPVAYFSLICGCVWGPLTHNPFLRASDAPHHAVGYSRPVHPAYRLAYLGWKADKTCPESLSVARWDPRPGSFTQGRFLVIG